MLLVLTGLLGGVVIHIVAVLAFPSVGGRSLWDAVEPLGPEGVFTVIPRPSPGAESIAYLDPNMAHAICRFDLTTGPARIVASLTGFWTVGVFDARGQNLYSLTSGATEREILDLLIARPQELTPLRRDPPLVMEEAVVVDLAVDQAIVVIRAFAPDPALWELAAASLMMADCATAFDLSGPAPQGFQPGPVE